MQVISARASVCTRAPPPGGCGNGAAGAGTGGDPLFALGCAVPPVAGGGGGGGPEVFSAFFFPSRSHPPDAIGDAAAETPPTLDGAVPPARMAARTFWFCAINRTLLFSYELGSSSFCLARRYFPHHVTSGALSPSGVCRTPYASGPTRVTTS